LLSGKKKYFLFNKWFWSTFSLKSKTINRITDQKQNSVYVNQSVSVWFYTIKKREDLFNIDEKCEIYEHKTRKTLSYLRN